MKKSEERKLKKKKAQRKDYEKKRNINKNNTPKNHRKALAAGDGILPESKKITVSKKSKAELKEAITNTIADHRLRG